MGWLTKIFRGSTHNISEGQYNSRPAQETAWNEPSSSTVETKTDAAQDDAALFKAVLTKLDVLTTLETKLGDIDSRQHDEQAAIECLEQNHEIVQTGHEFFLRPPSNRDTSIGVEGFHKIFPSMLAGMITCHTFIVDILSEFNNEDIDRAIALSLLEEEQRKTKAIGLVQGVTERLAMDVFSVAWELSGIQNVFVAMPVVNQYTTMRVITIFQKQEDYAYQKKRLLARLLTGSILAHEMMHAWLRLKGYRTLSPDVEEGICQIESDTSVAYGDGFRAGNQAVVQYGLKRTLEHIRLTGTFPF
ncbi:hypothetical protein PR202_gb11625 [Eleusine coracana subsp. coracana]|uniref:Protein DA1-like domain-containing protein n=1 Tax=Eleusine coracana subsp. coracana TaxID=191504 RepID=A0AAV5EMP9_ELECO|nr:hypothetical protein PR202_gb11625 [Eleusine coracana subsp. coracana]